MNIFFKIIRTAFIVLFAASFLAFIGAVGGFGGATMPTVAASAAGGQVGCAWVIWASNRVIDYTGWNIRKRLVNFVDVLAILVVLTIWVVIIVGI